MKTFLQETWQMIVDSNLLNVLGAILILLIGWLIALAVSRKISKMILHFRNRNNTSFPDGSDVPQIKHADTVIGKTVYCIIMIFTVLGCFSVLKLNAAAEPLQAFISEIARYAPNIAGAALLIMIAWITATIAKTVTGTILQKSKLHERLAAQIGATEPEKCAEYTAKTVYYIVFLFFLPAILNVLKIYGITAPLQSMFEKIITYIPNILAACVILLIGLWAAAVIRRAVSGLIVISRLNLFGEKVGVSKIFGNSGLAGMAGVVSYILVAIPVVISSLTALKIDVLSNSVAGFFDKLLNATGNIIGASLIIFAAVLTGGFAAGMVSRLSAGLGFDRFISAMGWKSVEKGSAPSVFLGKLAFLVILTMALLAACDILGFFRLAELIRSFAVFGGNVILSLIVLMIGLWLSDFVAEFMKGKCNDHVITGVRMAVIIFTLALAVSNLNIGSKIVEIAFTLILGAASVAAAIAFGIGGKEPASKLLNDLMEKRKK